MYEIEHARFSKFCMFVYSMARIFNTCCSILFYYLVFRVYSFNLFLKRLLYYYRSRSSITCFFVFIEVKDALRGCRSHCVRDLVLSDLYSAWYCLLEVLIIIMESPAIRNELTLTSLKFVSSIVLIDILDIYGQ